MNDRDFVADYIDHMRSVMNIPGLDETLIEAKGILAGVREGGRKLLLAGNGASATMASHFAVDFTKQAGTRAIAFNDPALITAYGNDFGYEEWVANAIRHHADPGDAMILISSSGRSPNIVRAADVCVELGLPVLAFTGFDRDNSLSEKGTLNFWADSRAYNVIESVHAFWLGILCDLVVGRREYPVSLQGSILTQGNP